MNFFCSYWFRSALLLKQENSTKNQIRAFKNLMTFILAVTLQYNVLSSLLSLLPRLFFLHPLSYNSSFSTSSYWLETKNKMRRPWQAQGWVGGKPLTPGPLLYRAFFPVDMLCVHLEIIDWFLVRKNNNLRCYCCHLRVYHGHLFLLSS